ncbi:hypothetical protein Poli38472_011108 [Pythium oligandrum]|uniref:Nudix hydrolase domain-containing protein n=1 Tax=Pythium oligandrum TaxID=41045 RepID=A0A8K1CR69_PYTOL|nr:hypothetical protein Poli38472_011108 [Pythium oligandrum]|eukprot:TMW67488.1 hypothetical protein Poli38472_011108 [Pythium oligandrum]
MDVTTFLPRLQRQLAAHAADNTATQRPTSTASVAAIFRWKEQHKTTLQVLFIRRSINPRDAWSGQIAFPGGRRQRRANGTEWESSVETAQRETLEEIGLDLTEAHVQWLGSLPPSQTHLRAFWVGTEVFFIDASAEERAFTPVKQESEVADVFWVDVHELFNQKRYQRLLWPLQDVVRALRQRPRVTQVLESVLGQLSFGAIYLPRPTHAAPDDDMTQRTAHDFVLWGLTLGMLAKLFDIAEMPLPMKELGPQFESKRLGNVFLSLSRRPDVFLKRTLAVVVVCGAAITLYNRV